MAGEDAQTSPIDESRSFKLLQSVITLAVGVGTLLSASGFLIVKSYLSKLTDIVGYNIAPAQYVTAGIGFWLLSALILRLFWTGIRRRELRVLDSRLAEVDREIARFVPNRGKSAQADAVLAEAVRTKQAMRATDRFYLAVRLILYIAGASIIYGNILYGHIPRSLGGGEAATAVVILTPGVTAQDVNLTGMSSYPNRADVLIFAELNDGLLIQDRVSGHMVMIPSGDLVAVADSP